VGLFFTAVIGALRLILARVRYLIGIGRILRKSINVITVVL
jgi:hypothetical protein